MFLDTCILIDYSKGKIDIEDTNIYCFSSIVELEFLTGALNKLELKKLNQILSKFNLIETDQEILDLSTKLVNRYGLSHNMSIYDAIIASTCMIYEIPLWSYNKKDFKYIKELELIDE